jgi:hypothetical protein
VQTHRSHFRGLRHARYAETLRQSECYQYEIREDEFVQTTYVCPELDVIVAIDLPTDAQAISQLWSQPIQIGCPVCGGSHRMRYRDAYVTGLMAEFDCLPADVQRARIH